jgi:hypothetical protein
VPRTDDAQPLRLDPDGRTWRVTPRGWDSVQPLLGFVVRWRRCAAGTCTPLGETSELALEAGGGETTIRATIAAVNVHGRSAEVETEPPPAPPLPAARSRQAAPAPVVTPPARKPVLRVHGRRRPGGVITCRAPAGARLTAVRWTRSGRLRTRRPVLRLTRRDAGRVLRCRGTLVTAGSRTPAVSLPIVIRAS